MCEENTQITGFFVTAFVSFVLYSEKALSGKVHCGGMVYEAWRGPLQVKNPALQDSFG